MKKEINIFLGFSPWKKPFLESFSNSLILKKKNFFDNEKKIKKLSVQYNINFFTWGYKFEKKYYNIIRKIKNLSHLIVEDGFLRSYGLGSDFEFPYSIVIDKSGIYYNSRTQSDLEKYFNSYFLKKRDYFLAERLLKKIIDNDLTKYNIRSNSSVIWSSEKKNKILIIGQVETDASIEYGSFSIKTNIDLIKLVKKKFPRAYLIYKPHPDVQVFNRRGYIPAFILKKYVDHVEYNCSIVSCINNADEVHTICSLAGLEALIRKKKVVVYGMPFYSGWGLTIDYFKNNPLFKRRKKKLKLLDLFFITFIKYPLYWDERKRKYTKFSINVIDNFIKKNKNTLDYFSYFNILKKKIVKIILLLKIYRTK